MNKVSQSGVAPHARAASKQSSKSAMGADGYMRPCPFRSASPRNDGFGLFEVRRMKAFAVRECCVQSLALPFTLLGLSFVPIAEAGWDWDGEQNTATKTVWRTIPERA